MKLQEDLNPWLLLLFRCVVSIYTFITFVPECILGWVSTPEDGSIFGSEEDRAKRAKARSVRGHPQGPYRAVSSVKKLVTSLQPGLDTLDKMFEYAARRFPHRDCLGTREVISEEDEQQSDGKVFKKVKRGEEKLIEIQIYSQIRQVFKYLYNVIVCIRQMQPLFHFSLQFIIFHTNCHKTSVDMQALSSRK